MRPPLLLRFSGSGTDRGAGGSRRRGGGPGQDPSEGGGPPEDEAAIPRRVAPRPPFLKPDSLSGPFPDIFSNPEPA